MSTPTALEQIQALQGGTKNLTGFDVKNAYTEDWQKPVELKKDDV